MGNDLNATERTPVDALPGGRYRYVDNHDGTFNVLDVPILAAIPAGAFPFPPNKEAVDRKWMEKAIAKSKQREVEGHLGAVHVHHHGGKDGEVTAAGRLQLTRVGTVIYDGEPKDALFANLLRVPAEAFEKMRKGDLPYRSIEGEPWEKCEIVSLAIMPTETPYFRLPMLTIGQQAQPAVMFHALPAARGNYAVACSVAGGFSVLSHFAEEPAMPEPAVDPAVKAALPPEKPQAIEPAKAAAPAQDEMAKPPVDEKPKAEGAQKPKGGGMSGKIRDLFAQMMGLVMTALGEDEEMDPADKKDADKAPGEAPKEKPAFAAAPVAVVAAAAAAPVAAPAPEKPAEAPKAEAQPAVVAAPAPAVNAEAEALKIRLAEADAKIAALSATVEAKAKVDEVEADCLAAEGALAGHNVTGMVKAKMREVRKEGGKACLDAFTAVFAAHAPKDPPSTLAAATAPAAPGASPAPTSEEDSLLNTLGPVGPEVMAKARALIAQGKEYLRVNGRGGLTLADFVKSNLKIDGFVKA